MSIEGKVTIDLGAAGGLPVRVEYRQPVQIGRLLRGKEPDAAAALLPVVYSVCGKAQAHAAALALESACETGTDPATARSRAVLTALETWRETLLRIFLEWPLSIGGEPDAAAAREAMTLLPRMKGALFADIDPYAIGAKGAPDMRAALAIVAEAEMLAAELVLGEAGERFLARRGRSGLVDWSGSRQTQAAAFIRRLLKSGWMDEAGFEMPTLDLPDGADKLADWLGYAVADRLEIAGIVPETTPYSRRRRDPAIASLGTHGLGARYVARLVELARLPLEMRNLMLGRATPAALSASIDGYGVAIVEAARGLLAHAARVENGLIADYRIVSPTFWNFHRHGIAAQCLAAIGDSGARGELAHLVVRAVDPCVAYEVRAG